MVWRVRRSKMDEGELKSIRDAIRTAAAAIASIYETQNIELQDLLLEEVERVNDEWHVTFSFTRPGSVSTAIMNLTGAGPRRAFKRVRIDARTGRFLSMEIRDIQTNQPPVG